MLSDILKTIEAYEVALKLVAIFFLVCCGGLITGLTLGLMSLDKTNLQILMNSGDLQKREWAMKIQPIRENGHLLLVTFLLASTLTFESLPILIDPLLGGGVSAILFSTFLTLVFGEVIPQAIITRHGLWFGAMFAYPVQVLIWIMYIFAYPIALLLDWILGENHGVLYQRNELKELMAIHEASHGGSLTTDEVTIIRGALELNEKTVLDVMTSMEHVYMLDLNSHLDWKTLTEIQRAGYTRIPIYQVTKDNIVGVLLTKYLILIDPDDETPIKNVKIHPIPKVKPDLSLFDLLNEFQEGASHIAIVKDKRNNEAIPIGIVTLEDVIEELIQEEIIDETDVYVDVPKRIRAVRAASGAIRLNSQGVNNNSQYNTFVKNSYLKSGHYTAKKNNETQPLLSRNNLKLKKRLFALPKPNVLVHSQDDNLCHEELHRFYTNEDEIHHHYHLRPGTEEDLKRYNDNRTISTHPNQRSPNSPDHLTIGSI
ncbi:DUF21-domain-containing protein [Neoconidiobolus thromboides FSU 785]|nr:DUF21-domain-containing protein [Neoconidiobolus thromboides FSU 785]